MPQLDKLSFLNQLIWFFFFYIIFYYLMLKTFIPTLGQSLKLRAKLLNNLTAQTLTNVNETKNILSNSLLIVNQINSLLQNTLTNKNFQETFFTILETNKTTSLLKKVYVKELANIMAKKRFLTKK